MQLISACFEEHHKRWNKIGHICGFHVSSPVVKSPNSSQSPRSSESTVVTQKAISYLRYNRRTSSFSSQTGQSEFVYPTVQPYPNPSTRFSHLTRTQSGLSRISSNLSQTESSRHSIPPSIPSFSALPDLSTETGTTDSIDSASSSSSSIFASWSKRADGYSVQTELLQDATMDGGGSEKGSREGSVEAAGRPASGKLQARESQEKKLASPLSSLVERKAESTDGEGGKAEQLVEKAKASPRAIIRNRAKRTTFSSEV